MYLHQVLSAEDTAAEIRERIGYYQQVPAGAMQRVLFPWKWGECIDYRLSLGRPWLGIWATSCCFCFFSGFSES